MSNSSLPPNSRSVATHHETYYSTLILSLKWRQTRPPIIAIELPPDLHVLIGLATPNPKFAIVTGEKPLFNSIALLAAGKVQNIFHKRLLPTYDVFDENRYFTPGSEANYFTLDGIKIGVTVCEDLWNDEDFWGKRSYLVNPIAELADTEYRSVDQSLSFPL